MPAKSPLRRVALFTLGPLAALLVAIPVLAMVIDVGGVVRKQLLALKPGWEEQLGRKIRLGEVKLRLLPNVIAEVQDIAIEAADKAPTGPAPLLTLSAARLGVAVWPLFTGEVRINNIEVAGLAVTVVRAPDGSLSYEDILERQQSDEKPSKPLTEEQLAYLRRLSLSRVAVRDASLRFQDLSVVPATNVAISKVNLLAEDLALGKPLAATLSAAVLADTPNFDLGVHLAPLPQDLKVEKPLSLVQRVTLKVRPLQLDPLLRFLPPAPLQARSALLDCDLALTTPAAAGSLSLVGSAGLRGLTLTHDARRGVKDLAPAVARAARETVGTPTDLGLKVDLSFGLLSGDLLVKDLALTINDMSVRGNADARALFSAPRVQALALASQGLLLEKLLALLPSGMLPAGTTLRGPLTLSASGRGDAARADLEAAVDLGGAVVQTAAFVKPAGTPLSATFKGALLQEGNAVRIDRLGLIVGPLSLLLSGTAKPSGDADLTLDSGAVALDRLLRLLPTIEKSVPKGTELAGTLAFTGHIKKQGQNLNAEAALGLSGADLETADIALSGAAKLGVKAQTAPGSAALQADADLTGVHLLVPGTVDKARGVPMELHLSATTAGDRTTVKTATLQLPGADVALSGTLSGGKPGTMDLKAPVDLDLGRLSQVLPPLRKGLPHGVADSKVKLALAVSGDPKNLDNARAKLSGFELRAAGGHFSGDAEVEGLSEPRRVRFAFNGSGMDVSRFVSDSDSKADDKPTAKSAPVKVPPMLRRMDLEGKVRVTDARYKTSTIKEVVLEVVLREGKLVLKALRGSAFSGTLDASGSTVDLAQSPPRFDLRADMKKVEMADVLALRGDSSTKITGRADLLLTAKGSGLSYEDIAPNVGGALNLGLNDGKLHTASVVARVVNPILEHLQQRVGNRRVSEEMALRDLSARFQIHDGKLETSQPLALKTDEGALRVSGAVGLDQRLMLRGDIQIEPQAISAASGGKIVPSGPLPVSLKIGGTLKAPEIEIVDLPRTALALGGMLLKGKAKGVLDKLPGGLGDKLGGVPTNQEDLQKKAQEEAAAAQRRVQEEAQRRAQEAEQRLRDEAKKRLGGLGGLLGN